MGYELKGYAPLPAPRENIADPTMVHAAYQRGPNPPPPPRRRWPVLSTRTVAQIVVGLVLLPPTLLVLVLLVAAAMTVGLPALLGVLAGLAAVAVTGALRLAGVIPPRRAAVTRRR